MNPGPMSLSSPPNAPPNQKPIWTMNDAIEAKKLASVITITSRFWTWVSSWPSTRLELAVAEQRRIPVVAQTVAVLGERPTANAFGIGVVGDRDAWLWQVRLDAEPLDDRVQAACILGVAGAHLAGAHRQQGDLVRGEQLDQEQRPGHDRDRDRAGAGGEQHADQHGIYEPEQEQGQDHPGLKPAIAAEVVRARHNEFILADCDKRPPINGRRNR